jgi:hypothetical protein
MPDMSSERTVQAQMCCSLEGLITQSTVTITKANFWPQACPLSEFCFALIAKLRIYAFPQREHAKCAEEEE